MSRHTSSMLCLGDSYTIGEGVPLHESFPYQLVQQLRTNNIPVHAPEVVAKTGWSSFELAEHLIHHVYEDVYDWVTLCIGVNNEYRGLSDKDFAEDLKFLVRKAKHFAGEKEKHVIVLSIPDYSVTPFAKNLDTRTIAARIDQFNTVVKAEASLARVHFIDITVDTRAHTDKSMLAADGLHYAAAMHEKWVEKIKACMISPD